MWSGPADAAEIMHRKGDFPASCQNLADELGLVESPLPQSLVVQGYRHDPVGRDRRLEVPKGAGGQEGQGPGQVDLFSVLEAMDEILYRALEACRGPGTGKRASDRQTVAAGVIDAVFRGKRDAADRAEGRA